MKSKKVVSTGCLPAHLPVWPTITLWLLLERLHANPIVWGIVGTLMVMVWIGTLVQVFTQKEIELWKEND